VPRAVLRRQDFASAYKRRDFQPETADHSLDLGRTLPHPHGQRPRPIHGPNSDPPRVNAGAADQIVLKLKREAYTKPEALR
jgi:hypothetical protein